MAQKNTLNHQKNRIRTYVLRESRMTTAQQRALRDLYKVYQFPASDSPVSLTEVFPSLRNHVIEIGFGDGYALVQMARMDPHTGYVGVEVYRPGVGRCLLEIERLQIENVRVCTSDARDFLSVRIAPETFDGIHIFFPDPWPKKRHHKRRLIQSDFVELCVSRLKIQGRIFVVTDWENYADQIREILDANHQLEAVKNSDEIARPQTRFESKALEQGRVVREFLYVRVS